MLDDITAKKNEVKYQIAANITKRSNNRDVYHYHIVTIPKNYSNLKVSVKMARRRRRGHGGCFSTLSGATCIVLKRNFLKEPSMKRGFIRTR